MNKQSDCRQVKIVETKKQNIMYKVALFLLFVLASGAIKAQTLLEDRAKARESEQKVEIEGVKYWKTTVDFDVDNRFYSGRAIGLRRIDQPIDTLPYKESEYFYLGGEPGNFVDSLVRVHVLPILKQKQIPPVQKEGYMNVIIINDLNGKIKQLKLGITGILRDHLPLEVLHMLDMKIRCDEMERRLGAVERKLKLRSPEKTKFIFTRKTYDTKWIYDLEK